MLGTKVKLLREKQGLTQIELSQQIGIAQSSLGMIESNKRIPGRNTLKKLGTFFNVSIDYLLSDDENITKSKTVKNETNLKEIKLIKEFKKLNEKGKDEAIKRIKELTELSKYNNVEIAAELIPLAAHEKDGNFTKEDYKHDIDIMNNDDLWK